MSYQTTFAISPAAGAPGMLYDAGHTDIISRALSAAAGANPGDFVSRTGEDTAALPAAATDIATNPGAALGFVVRHQYQSVSEMASPVFAQYKRVSILRRGRIWLLCLDAIAAGDSIYVKHTSANFGRVSAVATNGALAPWLQCLIGGGAAGIGLFEVNLPGN